METFQLFHLHSSLATNNVLPLLDSFGHFAKHMPFSGSVCVGHSIWQLFLYFLSHTDPEEDTSVSKCPKESECGTTSLVARVDRRKKNWNVCISPFWENQESFFKAILPLIAAFIQCPHSAPPPQPFALFTRPKPTPSNPTAWFVLAIASVMISLKKNKILKETF